MQLARDDFLADAALAAQQHADVAVGHALDHRHAPAASPAPELQQGCAPSGILGHLRAEARHLGAQRLPLERVADRRFERRFADARPGRRA